VFQISSVLERGLHQFGPQRIDYSFYDTSGPTGSRLVRHFPAELGGGASAPPPEAEALKPADFRYVARFEVASRQWAMVCIATKDYLLAERSLSPWGALFAGLGGTIGVVTFFIMTTAFTRRAEALVKQVSSANRHLNAEVEERKSAEREVSHLNIVLEDRVERRTRLLQAANAELIVAKEEAERVHEEELRLLRSREAFQEALRESEERYALAARGSKDGLWDWNLITGRIYFSQRWKTMLGYRDEEISDDPSEWLGRLHSSEIERVKTALDAHCAGRTPDFQSEHRVRHRDGAYRWMLTRGVAVFNENGRPARMAGSQTDVTAGKVADALTGLPNRLFLLDKLRQSIDRMREQPDARFAVLFLDLDRFKVINDSLGHLIGDKLLLGIAKRLMGCVRESSLHPDQVTVARLGGDEFAVLLERIRSLAEARSFAEIVQRTMKPAFDLEGHQVFATASIGVTEGSAGANPDDLLRDADTAMYQAKAHGKARYEVFDDGMRAEAVERLELETDLRNAIEKGALLVHYQPRIALSSGKIVEFEALVRWNRPGHGLVLPEAFIPLAEETGLIVPLGRLVFDRACRQMAQWHRDLPGSAHIGVSVNVSGKQFAQPKMVAEIESLLRETGLPSKCLSVEITESVLFVNVDAAISVLKMLSNMGVGLKIDHFGTGFSSLNYLHRLPVNELKIDRSFIEGMGRKESDNIVRTIVMLARALGLSVVADGVSTNDQLQKLALLGCDYAQGALFSDALDHTAARRLLELNLAAEPAPVAVAGSLL